MPTKLARWGNSLGLRIGRQIAECASLKVGDQMYVRVLDSGDILVRAVRPRAIPAGYKVPGGNESEGPVREQSEEEIRAKW